MDENGNLPAFGNLNTQKIRSKKKTVFQFDENEIYELFSHHGISSAICDALLNSGLDGKNFLSWIEFSNSNSLKKYLIQRNFNLTDDEATHLFAIITKYKKNKYSLKNKLIGDNVHGQINVHPLLVKIIDTPQFQRLRHLKQLGTLSFVYPTANHTRFEHSIGTSHICDIFMRHLKETQPSLKIALQDELCVRIAGLCHDLGHGPFSHMFEEVIEHVNPNTSWKHEEASLKLFDKMLTETENLREDFGSYGLFENDIQFIKDLIHADIFKNPSSNLSYEDKLRSLPSLKKKGIEKSYLFEIVSNNRNGIDVDKFDYFERDSMHLGFSNNFNYKRYIACSRVIKTDDGLNQIGCRDKNFQDLYEMFHVREHLTRRAYKHESGSSINLMVVEALKLASKHFEIAEMIDNQDMNKFEKLNDSVYLQILYSDTDELRASRELLQRVEKRKLYKYVGSSVIPPGKTNDAKLLKSKLMEFMETSSNNLINDSNMCIEIVKFNYGSKHLNPLENVKCYDKYRPNRAFKIEKHQVSGMLLERFEDVVIRVYSKKNDDYDFFDSVNGCFCSWCFQEGLPDPLYGMK